MTDQPMDNCLQCDSDRVCVSYADGCAFGECPECTTRGPLADDLDGAVKAWNKRTWPERVTMAAQDLPPLRLNITFEHEDGQMGKPVITDDLGQRLKGVRECEVDWEYQEPTEISVRLVNNPVYVTLGKLKK